MKPICALVPVALVVSCGFPRPVDIGSSDGGPAGDSTIGDAADCRADAECLDPAQPVCMSGRCLSPLDACRTAGARIVFLSDRGGARAIYGAYADGSSPKLMASGILADGNVAPSPDGAIAFVQKSTTDSNNNIQMVDAYGEKLTHIASVFGPGSYVEWSPDGAMLVVAERNSEQTIPASVYRVKRNAEQQQLLGYADAAAVNVDPSWSSDSAKVVFVSKSPDILFQIGIWTIDADGNHRAAVDSAPLLLNNVNFLTPRWAPDSTAVAYLSNEKGNFDIVLKPMNGTAARVLATPENESDLAWSHDGKKLAFVRASAANRSIWVMNADGSAPMTLAVGEHPRWSSDDKSLLFETLRDGNREIYRMNSDGTKLVNLTNDPADDAQAEWSVCPN